MTTASHTLLDEKRLKTFIGIKRSLVKYTQTCQTNCKRYVKGILKTEYQYRL
jgi:hypothetical protein